MESIRKKSWIRAIDVTSIVIAFLIVGRSGHAQGLQEAERGGTELLA